MRLHGSRAARGTFALLLAASGIAHADDATPASPDPDEEEIIGRRGEAEVHADDVSFDARQRELLLRGNVRVDSPPFHLRSDQLYVHRSPLGLVVKGNGR